MLFSKTTILSIALFAASACAAPTSGVPDTVWRSETKPPEQVEDDGGFAPRASANGVPPDNSLKNHVMPPGGQAQDNDNFVSTTADKSVADKFGKRPYNYEIDTSVEANQYRNVNEELPGNKFSKQQEFSKQGAIPAPAINSVEIKDEKGKVVEKKPMGEPSQPAGTGVYKAPPKKGGK
ncbi:hypothetical protein KVT40_008011 [Elsinoe batatas]|uniref:Pierisin-like domain-containing protein n=1 Tax=Elsinoe batatas TaxID=2601811 RepID=A0A8K0KW44_9PEZI|nr:hypothetical protein KVT40_008011 [Elsinoe batatas]